jgi:hypothetical protein
MPISQPPHMTRPTLRLFYEHFGQLARQMKEAYTLHMAPLNIGATRELFVSNFLRRHLPNALWVGRGEIIDSDGTRSGDCDVVVYRSTGPTIPTDAGETLHLFQAEGVDSVVEVKSFLSSDEMERCEAACRRIKSLRTGNRPDGEPGFPDIAIVPQGYNPEALSWIRYFVVAFDGISNDLIIDHLRRAHGNKAQDYYRYGIDGLCVLDRSYVYKNDGLIWPADSELAKNAGNPLVRSTGDLLCLYVHLTSAAAFTIHKSLHFADYLQRGGSDEPPHDDSGES